MSFEKRRGVAEQYYKREVDWKGAGVYVKVEIIIYELRKKRGVAEQQYKREAYWKELLSEHSERASGYIVG